jgi:ATP-dependent Clp protease ATP-binding subunit ClpX
MEKIIERRIGHKSLGFVTTPVETSPTKRNTKILEQVQQQDLMQYGLIPEFIGRLPVIGVLNDLDTAALVQILKEPRNSLIKQYQRLFEYEDVKLEFAEDALVRVAELAQERKMGARGLRMILEDLMLELMYHLPSRRTTGNFTVTREMVEQAEAGPDWLEKAG